MKHLEDHLNRLLKSAAAAPSDLSPELPLGFETRVLAHWRAYAEEDSTVMVALFRRAFFCCCALVVLTLGLSYKTLASAERPDVEIANSAIAMNLP